MWLLVLSYAAVFATLLWYRYADNDIYLFKYLALISWGASIMFFIDHVYGYLTEGGGEFFEVSVDAILLGFTLLLFILVIWLFILLIRDPRGVLKKH